MSILWGKNGEGPLGQDLKYVYGPDGSILYLAKGANGVNGTPQWQGTQLLDASGDVVVDLTSTNAASKMATGPLDLALDAIRDFNASGSTNTYTGSIAAGSKILTLTAAGDFKNPFTNSYGTQSQGIAIANADAACTLTAPTGVSATQEGMTGSTSYSITVIAIDAGGGSTAAGTASVVANGNAALSNSNYIKVTWTASASAVKYAVYASGIGYCGQTGGTTFYINSNTAGTPPLGVPSSSPASASNDNFVTTVASGGGAATMTLADASTSAATSVAVYHDDRAAVQSCLTNAQSTQKPAHFGSGTYRNAGTAWQVTPATQILCDTGCVFDGSAASGDGFILEPGFHTGRMIFHEVANFAAGTAIRLYGAQLAYVWFNFLTGCNDSILWETDDTNLNCQDNTVEGMVTTYCWNGIRVKATSSSCVMQGNIIRANFMEGHTNWLVWDAAGSVTPGWAFNLFEVEAVDGLSVPESTGITTTGNVNGISGEIFYCRTFFGGFTGDWINLAANGNRYEIQWGSTPAYSQISIIAGVANYINSIEASTPALSQTPIACATASGSRSSWNGGTPVLARRIHASVTIPAGGLAAGSTMDFYLYHLLLTGNTGALYAVPRWAATMVVIACEDESAVRGTDGNYAANQIHLSVLATANVAAGTYNVDVVVEG